MSQSIETILQGLDDQQRAAAQHVQGPGLIVAGAGAGKTTVLVRRLAYLIKQGISPHSILLLTFTRQSAKSIMDRARAFVPEARDITGGTFHSIAARIIRENHRMFGLPEGFTVIDPSDVDDILKRLIAESEIEGMTPRSRSVAAVISFARNTQRSIRDTIRLDQFSQHDPHIGLLEAVDRRYHTYKREHLILDYDDLLTLWAKMVEHEDIGPRVRQRFSQVMVDEYQDTNPLQLRIVYGLGGENPNIMVVGDPSQSIFGFRGSSPGIMFDFKDRWPDTKTYLIETNYRSTPEIVQTAGKVDASLLQRFDRQLRAHKPSAGIKPKIVHTMDLDGEGEWIVEQILRLREEGTPLKEQAILVRSMRKARSVEAKLAAAGIPYKTFGGIKLHEAAHIKDLICVLRIVTNPADEPAWLRYLTLFKGVGPKKALKLIADIGAVSDTKHLIERAQAIALTRKELAAALPAIRLAHAARTAAEALGAVRRELLGLLEERWAEEWEWRQKDIEDIINLAATMGSTEDFLRTVTIDLSIDKKSEAKRSQMDDEEPLSLSTIHASKGLEWEAIFIPQFISGHIPLPFAETGEEREEETRLFYVALTRSKRELYLMRPASIMSKGEPMMVYESSFQAIIKSDIEPVHVQNSVRSASLNLETEMTISDW